MSVYGPAGFASYAWSVNGMLINETTQQVATNTNGDYTLVVTDTNGCVSTASAVKKIKFRLLPNPTIKVQKVYSNGSVRLTANSGASFQWYFNDTLQQGETGRYYIITQTGNYKLFMVGQNGCGNMSIDTMIVVNYNGNKLTPEEEAELNGEEDNDEQPDVMEEATDVVSVAPNPSTGIFHIYSAEPLRAVVRDLQGKLVADKHNALSIDLTERASGIYILQLYNSAGALIQTEKLNKQ